MVSGTVGYSRRVSWMMALRSGRALRVAARSSEEGRTESGERGRPGQLRISSRSWTWISGCLARR